MAANVKVADKNLEESVKQAVAWKAAALEIWATLWQERDALVLRSTEITAERVRANARYIEVVTASLRIVIARK